MCAKPHPTANPFAPLSLSGLKPAIAELKQEIPASSGGVIIHRILDFFHNTLANPACPPWTHKIAEKLNKVGHPLATADKYSTMTPYEQGRALGFTLSALSYMKQQQLPVAANNAEGLRIQTDFVSVIPQLMAILTKESGGAFGGSPEDVAEFTEGLTKGLHATGGGAENLTPINDRLTLYKTLLYSWPKVVEFKNRLELYQWLRIQLPANILGSQRRFYDLCDDIGLRLSQRGRPRLLRTRDENSKNRLF